MPHPSPDAARLSRNRFVLVDVRRSLQTAKNFMDEFNRQIDLFCSPPDVFALNPLPKLAAKGYRSFFVNNYIVLVALDGDIVRVRIFSSDAGLCEFGTNVAPSVCQVRAAFAATALVYLGL